ncbi:sigma-70 family RNA polymerase sigma factor [Gillisia sp. M10.2A]|uniref:Sigma-70 family RNA polymerase sigma factor n=1 Tax=Gillisia lutea TaxID=2909668 RepID=A0ABS9EE75_9FLAO|nr:sigma-70 family RNA polymerase sigma factor [Gillisia lutea]MCF4101083.1 sigma-70 family RNA polymerase sigma factor [Gillisia lutea]
MNLKKLISLCKKQDRKAQEEVYRTFSGKFFILCLKYASSYEQAKDCLQDGFIKIFQNIHQFKGSGSFEGWMTRIIINTALKEYHNKPTFLRIEEAYTAIPEVEFEEEDMSLEFLIQIIQELPDRYRLVFNLYTMDGYTHQEISEMLNISIGTSKSNLSRARLKLKEKIECCEKNKMEKRL